MSNFYENTEKTLKRLEEQVGLIVAKMKIETRLDPDDIIIDNQEFMQLMNISKRTAQEWRTKKIIHCSQIGNKIYYRYSDIKKMINDNYNTK